ncbi:MAG: SprB repeat-containing protein, partial [Vicingaceae bacterium]
MKHCAVLVFSFLLSSALVAQNFNDTIDYPGDIAFIGFSAGPGGASDEDGFSFVLLDSCPPNTLIRFTDEEWLGTAFASLGAAADVTWENTTGSGISAGTVIDMTDTDNNNSGISASSGTAVVDFGVFSVASGDQIYAFLGTRASPFPFLAFIGQDSSLNSSQTAVLDGTGLVAGKTAILTNTEGYFSGSTTCGTDIAACIATINDSANWTLGPYTHPTPVASGFSGAAFAPPAVSISITTQIDNVCVGGSDGQLIATAVPGMGNYTYDWSNSASTINTISTKDTISGLVAGTYTVTVTDANLNTATATATITSPGGPAFSATLFISPVLCHGDSNGQAIAVPNQFPSTYIWSNSETTQTIDSLPAGPYSVTITNNSGCSIVRSISLSEPDSLEITTTVSNNATCNGFTDGSISSTRMGGSGPFTYNWSNGATSANLNSLGAGTYTVTITDNNGCTDTSSSVITQPTPLVVSTVIDSSASCSGGSNGGITASASGSVPTYNYLWSNGATTPSITGIATGTYTVTVTDMAGCTGTSSETVTQPPPLVPSTTVDNNVSCNGGSDGQGTVSAVGGTAPYTYNWSNLVTTASNSGLSVGTYTVTVTDNNGCFELDSVVITEPAAIVASISSSTNLTCNGVPTGAATASATGGTGAYTYTWSNAATT